MTDRFAIEDADGYLRVTFTGPFSLDAAKRSVDAMVSACARTGNSRVMFDCREMSGDLSVMNRFEVAEYGASVVPPTLKIAMLGRPDQLLPDRFLENVARNRGMTMNTFSDVGEAIGWLMA